MPKRKKKSITSLDIGPNQVIHFSTTKTTKLLDDMALARWETGNINGWWSGEQVRRHEV